MMRIPRERLDGLTTIITIPWYPRSDENGGAFVVGWELGVGSCDDDMTTLHSQPSGYHDVHNSSTPIVYFPHVSSLTHLRKGI